MNRVTLQTKNGPVTERRKDGVIHVYRGDDLIGWYTTCLASRYHVVPIGGAPRAARSRIEAVEILAAMEVD